MKHLDYEAVKITDEEIEKAFNTFFAIRDYVEENFQDIQELMFEKDAGFGDAALAYYLMYDCNVQPSVEGMNVFGEIADYVYADYEAFGGNMLEKESYHELSDEEKEYCNPVL